MIKYDFIIIGAGISGLYIASELNRLNKSYVLLETQDKIGGRIHTHVKNNLTFEFGAARILSNHHKALNLAEKLNIKLVEQHNYDSAVFWEGTWYDSVDEIFPIVDFPNPISLFGELLLNEGIDSLEKFKKNAKIEWDNQLTADWLDKKGVPFKYAKLFFIGDIDVNLEQITLYESLFFYLVNLSDIKGKIYRVKEGMSQFYHKFENQVNNINLNQQVLKVVGNSNGFCVTTNNQTFETKQVVFTCSLTAISQIELPKIANKTISNWLEIGHYGASLKGYLLLNKNYFPLLDNLISDEPVRFIRRSDYEWEFYIPSLYVKRDFKSVKQLFEKYFGQNSIVDLKIKNYVDSPFFGCYWNYRKGNFHRIFEASKTNLLTEGIFSVGEHFSLNPNWIEGSLESADHFLTNLY